MKFCELTIGQAFRIRAGKGFVGGTYFKTSQTGYGKSAGMELWPVRNLSMPVEAKGVQSGR